MQIQKTNCNDDLTIFYFSCNENKDKKSAHSKNCFHSKNFVGEEPKRPGLSSGIGISKKGFFFIDEADALTAKNAAMTGRMSVKREKVLIRCLSCSSYQGKSQILRDVQCCLSPHEMCWPKQVRKVDLQMVMQISN